jgi:uncharacterized protein with HEPN domain
MKGNRLPDYLAQMRQSAFDACTFVEGLDKDDFIADKRTQQAVVMSLVIIGEAVTKILKDHAVFARENDQLPWHSMKGMRNRIAHGYFDINMEVVWDTVQTELPKLLKTLDGLDIAPESHYESDYGMEP